MNNQNRNRNSMSGLLNEFVCSARQLARSPRFFVIGVSMLALGIGASSAVFSIVDHLILRDLPFVDAKQLVSVWRPQGNTKAEFLAVRDRTTTLDDVSAYSTAQEVTLSGAGEPTVVSSSNISANLFSLLGVQPLLGRHIQPEDEVPGAPAVTVLSHAFWQERFGTDAAALGERLTLDGQQYEIVGVLSANVRFPAQATQLYLPMTIAASVATGYWADGGYMMVGRLRSEVDIAAASDELASLAAQIRLENLLWTPDEQDYIASARMTALQTYLMGDIKLPLFVLLASVLAVLLIACINLANLYLARAIARQRELAIKAAIGAGRARIIRETLLEAAMVAVTGGVCGLMLAVLVIELIPAILPLDIPDITTLTVDIRVLLFTFVATLVSVLVSGIVPALRAASMDPHATLASGHSIGGRHQNRLANILVSAQVALAVVLLVCAGLLLRSLTALQNVDTGFDVNDVITAKLDPVPGQLDSDIAVTAFYEDLLEQLRASSGSRLAVTTQLPFSDDLVQSAFAIEGYAKHSFNREQAISLPSANLAAITEEYLQTMAIPLLRGRGFERTDRADAVATALISASLAQAFFGDKDPIGQRIGWPWLDEWWTIVGVVGDVSYANVASNADGFAIYRPFNQAPAAATALVMRSAEDTRVLINRLRQQLDSSGRDVALSKVSSTADLVASSLSQPRFTALILTGFAAAALLLAALGVYAIVTQMVNRRLREISLRMAVGANPLNIFALVLSNTMILAGVGIAAGMLAAVMATRLLVALLYEITPMDPITFVTVPSLILITALIAVLLPASHAVRVQPMEVLRSE